MRIAYYSSNVFLQSGVSQVSALAASLGFGALNWIFALPAVFTVSAHDAHNSLVQMMKMMKM